MGRAADEEDLLSTAQLQTQDRFDIRTTPRLTVAGAPPPSAFIERLEKEMGWQFQQIYGLTETAPLLTINRSRTEWDDDTPAERASKLSRQGVPAVGITMATDSETAKPTIKG